MNNSIKKLNKVLKSLAIAGICLLIFTPQLSARFLWFGKKKTEKEQAIEQKARNLKSDSPAERALAAEELIELAPSEGAGKVSAALENETNPRSKRTMIQALGRSGNEEAAGPVRDYLTDPDKETRLYAASALAELGEDTGLEELQSVAADLEESRGKRSYAIRALGEIKSDRAIEILAGLLDDNDAAIRLQAAVSLYRIGTQEAIDAIKTLTDDPEEHIRETVGNLLESGNN